MNKAARKEYKRKLDYISENAKRIDYDWFTEDGVTIFIDDLQHDKKLNRYFVGYLVMNHKGEFFVYCDEQIGKFPDSWDRQWASVSSNIRPRKYKPLRDIEFEWFFKYISVNDLMWKINKIYEELSLLEFKSH